MNDNQQVTFDRSLDKPFIMDGKQFTRIEMREMGMEAKAAEAMQTYFNKIGIRR